MKASTLFILSIALLVGLGAAAAARYVGLFDKRNGGEVVIREDTINVLVAAADLHKGIAITSENVRIRELRSDERSYFDQNRANILPPVVSAAFLRIPNNLIKADSILRRKDFQDDLPDALSLRLDEDMRGVTVGIPKDRSAGGVLQLGEYVDVWLTCTICEGPNCERPMIRKAQIAKDCRIIVKRNNLRTVTSVDSDDKPISYTLQANPYRAALIEYAQYKGQLSLMPVFSKDATPLEAKRPTQSMPRSFTDMNSKQYADEDIKIQQVKLGDLVVGDEDLERIFKLNKVAPVPGPGPLKVRNVRGIQVSSEMVFNNPDTRAPATSNNPYLPVPPRQQDYQFGQPNQLRPSTPASNGQANSQLVSTKSSFTVPQLGQSPEDCPDCEKNKRAGSPNPLR